MLEIVLAAFILGVSALPILELIRASTTSLEITEVEAAARSLAADVLERLAGDAVFEHALVATATLNADAPFDVVLGADPTLSRAFPMKDLGTLLRRHRLTLRIQREEDVPHPGAGPAKGFDRYTVRARWLGTNEQQREVTLVRLFARR